MNCVQSPLAICRIPKVSDWHAAPTFVDSSPAMFHGTRHVAKPVAPREKLVPWKTNEFARIGVEPSFSESNKVGVQHLQMVSKLPPLELINDGTDVGVEDRETG